MGHYKDLLQQYQDRGYGPSDKYVCGCCVKDEYLKKKIWEHGSKKHRCSFCHKYNKACSLETLMQYIMPAIEYYFDDAEAVLPYDSEEDEYIGNYEDLYYFVHDTLGPEMQADNAELLDEIIRMMDYSSSKTSSFEYGERKFEKELNAWNEYCELVNARSELYVEQIVSLCRMTDAPDDLKAIHGTLRNTLNEAQQMHAFRLVYPSEKIYRAVNYIKAVPDGFSSIPAPMVGTAPASCSASGRFNESGDMMFYGTSDPDVAIVEVGPSKDGNPMTVGEFHTNKRIRVLDLSELPSWKMPSGFDLEQKEGRESWLFLNRFIKEISKPVDDTIKELTYKPLQVFMKYIQRVTGLYGLAYKSSKAQKSNGKCYVLFAGNRDCIDEKYRATMINDTRLQLYMSKVWQK
jgi:hypothetical protein